MKRVFFLLILCLCFTAPAALADSPKRLKAIMFVGGCCHDYKVMPFTLAKAIEKLAAVDIEVKPVATAEDMAKIFKEPTFADGYDIVIYDICFGEKWNDGDYDGALKAAEGKPAMFVHCSAHTYRPPRDPKAPNLKEREAIADAKWHALVGMHSIVHDKFGPFATEKSPEAKDQPIIKSFPDNWKTEGDELYNTVKMMPTATPLLTAKSPASGKVHTVAWINHFGKTRIFGTTLGHNMTTGADPNYQRLLADGLLWACDKLGDDGKPVEGYGSADVK